MKKSLSWSFLSTSISSIGNFFLTIVVLRTEDAAVFGTFALAFAGYVFVLSLNRAMTGSRIIVRFSSTTEESRDEAIASSCLLSSIIGSTATLLYCFTGFYYSYSVVVVLGLALPGAMVLDTLRYGYFARSEPRGAAFIDIVWTGATVIGFAALATIGALNAISITVAWGAAALLTALLFCYAQLRNRLAMSIFSEFRQGWRDRLPLALEMGAQSGTDLLVLATVGWAASSQATTGIFRTTGLVQAPFTIAISSAILAVVPRMIARRASDPGADLTRPLVQLGLGFAVLGTLICLFFYICPPTLGSLAFGSQWSTISTSSLDWIFPIAAVAVGAAAFCGLRAIVALSCATFLRIGFIPVFMAFTWMGVIFNGVSGAIAALGVSNLALAAAGWIAFVRRQRLSVGAGL